MSHCDFVNVTLYSHSDFDKATLIPNMHYIKRIWLQILRNIKNWWHVYNLEPWLTVFNWTTKSCLSMTILILSIITWTKLYNRTTQLIIIYYKSIPNA
jgi:hypothetical protein